MTVQTGALRFSRLTKRVLPNAIPSANPDTLRTGIERYRRLSAPGLELLVTEIKP